ncbi:MAG: hypothetical protein KDA47_16155, partial [Planctomycetales bacterium]|nr:hypothetical protein [Planctomycetales bacterium]
EPPWPLAIPSSDAALSPSAATWASDEFAETVSNGYFAPATSPPTEAVFPSVRLDTELFRVMLDFQNRQNDKELALLEHNAAFPYYPVLLIGAQARLSLLAAATNTDSKFSYLGRFPPDFRGRSATDARIVQANAGLAAHVNPWINLYGELLFSDVFTFPDFKQGSLQTRQAYATFGDLNQSSWYAFIGKKNVPFGDMSTLSPFSQSVVWHYFGALHEGLGVGYSGEHMHVVAMGINGGRGIRVADSESRGQLNNFAVNATFLGGGEHVAWRLGGGFLRGTIYDATIAEHTNPNAFGPYNSAWDVNAQLNIGRLIVAGEFVSTVDDWPATEALVSAYRAETAFDGYFFSRPTRYSVSWSEGIQGPSGSEFEFNQQLVLGMGIDMGPHALLSFEYVRSSGFAPLLDITTVSDRGVVQDSLVMGITVVL